MGVEIESQLGQDKVQRLQLCRCGVGQGSGGGLEMKGKIQPGEEGTVGDGILLVVDCAALLLKGDIGIGQGGTGGKCPAAVLAAAMTAA